MQNTPLTFFIMKAILVLIIFLGATPGFLLSVWLLKTERVPSAETASEPLEPLAAKQTFLTPKFLGGKIEVPAVVTMTQKAVAYGLLFTSLLYCGLCAVLLFFAPLVYDR